MRNPAQVQADSSLVMNGGPRRITHELVEDTGIAVTAADDVADIVRTGRTVYWGGGPRSKRLEREFADHIGRSMAFFHNSGTAALQTALFALGVTDGTPVAITDSGFVASLNVIQHLRARPVFLPTAPETLLCQEDVSDWVDGVDVHTALLTHFFGNVLDAPATFASTGAEYLVEDAGQAHGATLRGRPVGSFGDIGSFAGSHKKLVTSGQGGLNVYDDPTIDFRMRAYAHHGHSQGENIYPGYNFRGGEMEATLGLAALADLPTRVAARNRTAAAITEILEKAGLTVARTPAGLDCTPAWFDVPVLLDESWLGHRDWLIDVLRQDGIELWKYPALIALPWVKPYMANHGWWGEREEELLRVERRLWDRLVLIPTQISAEDGRVVAEALAEILS
ncbi:DegT/DnrJ/EryC1/StrS family aminotransferase [Actinophytocola xinjiangensis]|nr:DegT/DnrJ/EryC1/StrS family aminotransferase [Actinophytocola xinjiangensis]